MAGLYIHLPWCVRKCPYCDFNSHNQPEALPEAAYVAALISDLKKQYAQARQPVIDSIFFGGGTPSLFSVASIAQIMQAVRDETALSESAEITLEANPGTFEQAKFEGFRAAGVNRLSLGIQSFDADKLTSLGRIHGREEALKAARSARAAGFDNFNLDLMYALPNQSLEQALEDIDQAIALNPTHLSHYQLTLEPNTQFYKQPPILPDDDTAWSMMEACQARLAEAGYAQYEVSAYAQKDRQAAHNLNYWRYGDYLGIGAGAHAKLTLADGRVVRLRQPASPEAYMLAQEKGEKGFVADVPLNERVFEFMLNGLRLKEGVTRDDFERTTGLDFEAHLLEKVQAQVAEGMMTFDPLTGRFKPSHRGWNYLNNLQAEFLR